MVATAIDRAARAVQEAAEYAQARHADGPMGLVFASRAARDAAASLVDASDAGPVRAAARLSADHCEQLEAGQGPALLHAYGALEAAWSAVEHASPSTMGDAVLDAGEAQAVAEIQSQLGPALNDPDTLAHVVNAYTGLPVSQANSILGLGNSILQGHAPTLASLVPLIAGALAITGVGAPIIAAVAAALPLLADLASALGIIPGPPNCTFTVGGVCFSQTIPYGPVDPTTGQPNLDWRSFAGFIAANGGPPKGPNDSLQGHMDIVGQAFPYYWMIAQELPVIDDVLALYEPPKVLAGGPSAIPSGTLSVVKGGALTFSAAPSAPAPPPPQPRQVTSTTNVWLFLRTYYTLWTANAEQAINGHPYSSDADLLAACVGAWNAVHDATAIYVFQPATVGVEQVPPVVDGTDLTNPSFPTFVSMLLGGAMDGHAQPPMRMNIGPAHNLAPAAPTGSSSSSGALVLGALALAAAGAASYGGLLGQGAESAVKGLLGGRQ